MENIAGEYVPLSVEEPYPDDYMGLGGRSLIARVMTDRSRSGLRSARSGE